MSSVASMKAPKLWKYLLVGVIVLIILIPLWAIFVMLVIQPESLMTQEQTLSNRLSWWVAGPVIVVAALLGSRWISASKAQQTQQQQVLQTQDQHAAAAEQSKREYVLEVIGLGVTLDKYRQGKLWEALQQGSPYVTIREQDPKKYPWSESEKSGLSGGRGGDTLENGAQYTPMYWGVPVFNAQSPSHNPYIMDKPDQPIAGLAGGAVSSGMAWHLFTVGPRRFAERPDRILEDVFAFFDANPDIPYVVLNANDDGYFRDLFKSPGTPIFKDGHYIPDMPDASALFVLARRERVEPLRPFVWDDPDNRFLQKKLRSMYVDLERAVPHPKREQKFLRTPAAVGADATDQEGGDGHQRQPTVAEWLEATAAFAKRPDVSGSGTISMIKDANPFAHHPPRDWKPTPWFPVPWNRAQLATFDRLPTLGFIHRPTFVKFTDAQGQPLTRRDQREQALQAGWQQALQTLPESERSKAPARIVTGTGNNTEQLISLQSVLNHHASQGGPEIGSNQTGKLIDTDKRLGNTGAATWFMQIAIGVMGSYREGGVSAAINLRDATEASIVLISPPSEEQRKKQTHPNGGDVFAHHGTPAIDPANYRQP